VLPAARKSSFDAPSLAAIPSARPSRTVASWLVSRGGLSPGRVPTRRRSSPLPGSSSPRRSSPTRSLARALIGEESSDGRVSVSAHVIRERPH
jgi:hypothetical protein